jgi:hypothetical protein
MPTGTVVAAAATAAISLYVLQGLQEGRKSKAAAEAAVAKEATASRVSVQLLAGLWPNATSVSVSALVGESQVANRTAVPNEQHNGAQVGHCQSTCDIREHGARLRQPGDGGGDLERADRRTCQRVLDDHRRRRRGRVADAGGGQFGVCRPEGRVRARRKGGAAPQVHVQERDSIRQGAGEQQRSDRERHSRWRNSLRAYHGCAWFRRTAAGTAVVRVISGVCVCCFYERRSQIAAGIEGHPDNVAPAIYGGIQIGYDSADGMGGTGRWCSERCRFPDSMQCILYIPYTTAKTSEARGLLKDQIERTEAVRSSLENLPNT